MDDSIRGMLEGLGLIFFGILAGFVFQSLWFLAVSAAGFALLAYRIVR